MLESSQLFEKKEIFAHIRQRGLQIDDSLLQEFLEQGIIDNPIKRGRGRARGKHGLWTTQQRNLLEALCALRQRRGIRNIAARCNVPIWIWLYWGDMYSVTLPQVKKAMHTWALRQRITSLDQARKGARSLVNQVANHQDGGKQKAIRQLSESFYVGNFSEQLITDSLAHVFDPTRAPNGPVSLPILPEGISRLIALRAEAIDRLRCGPDFPDLHWQWARGVHLFTIHQYVQEQSQYIKEAQGTSVEALFSLETLETLCSAACEDLATILAFGVRNPDPSNVPDILRLAFWLKHIESSTVTSERLISPLILLNGSRPQSLRINMNIRLKK